MNILKKISEDKYLFNEFPKLNSPKQKAYFSFSKKMEININNISKDDFKKILESKYEASVKCISEIKKHITIASTG